MDFTWAIPRVALPPKSRTGRIGCQTALAFPPLPSSFLLLSYLLCTRPEKNAMKDAASSREPDLLLVKREVDLLHHPATYLSTRPVRELPIPHMACVASTFPRWRSSPYCCSVFGCRVLPATHRKQAGGLF